MKKLFTKTHGELYENHPLASYTSWKIGGPAECFYHPTDLADLAAFLKHKKKGSILLLGAATNVLIRDAGVKGIVIYLRGSLNELHQVTEFSSVLRAAIIDKKVSEDSVLRAEAGVSISRLVQQCVHLDLAGAAFLAGIPGTVGGALAMNAGAFGDSIWNHVIAVETINRKGQVKIRKFSEFNPRYRHVDGLVADEWFVAGYFKFDRGAEGEAETKVRDIIQQRQASQPVDQPSCGSVFKNPPGDYAARLIEACGLKGRQIGGAKISDKHANFIVNEGEASASDVEKLIQLICDTVAKKCNIRLETEVHIFGDKLG
jgi:UDP-N-acetylmuramate dehydrogenase